MKEEMSSDTGQVRMIKNLEGEDNAFEFGAE